MPTQTSRALKRCWRRRSWRSLMHGGRARSTYIQVRYLGYETGHTRMLVVARRKDQYCRMRRKNNCPSTSETLGRTTCSPKR